MDPRVQKTIDIMTSQLAHRLRVAELAAGVGLSVAQLTRLFRRDTGTTPGAFLRRVRRERARVLLARTSLPVREVMTQVGFSDPSHFARDFSQEYGSSPRTFRLERSRNGATADPERHSDQQSMAVNCAACGRPAVVIHTTPTGEYWQCEGCAHMWSSERDRAHPPAGSGGRRRTD